MKIDVDNAERDHETSLQGNNMKRREMMLAVGNGDTCDVVLLVLGKYFSDVSSVSLSSNEFSLA